MADSITIPLTQGQVTVIDADDYELVSKFKWIAQRTTTHGLWYAIAYTPMVDGKRSQIGMHRLILQPPPKFDVDHIDGDGLNNRRSNLRVATRSLNRMNSGLQKNNTSGFKGVSFNKALGKWQAHIGNSGRKRFLGFFATPEEAAHAYDTAAYEYAGEFAWLNFRDGLVKK